MLGVVPDAAYGERRESLHSGDRLLAYTDGLVEGRDEQGRMLGEEGLLEVLDARERASSGVGGAGSSTDQGSFSPRRRRRRRASWRRFIATAAERSITTT